jgi:hypothetical protein
MRMGARWLVALASAACTTQFEDPPSQSQSLGPCARDAPAWSSTPSVKRWQLCVENLGENALALDFQVAVPLASLALSAGDNLQNLRVERYVSGAWTDAASYAESSKNSQLWFALSEAIAPGESDGSYFVILATQATPSGSIFKPLDDFGGAMVDTSHWTVTGNHTVSGGFLELAPDAQLASVAEVNGGEAVDFLLDAAGARPNAIFGFFGSSKGGIRVEENGQARLTVDGSGSVEVQLQDQHVLSVVWYKDTLHGLIDHVDVFEPLAYTDTAVSYGVEVLPSTSARLDFVRVRRGVWPPPAIRVGEVEVSAP